MADSDQIEAGKQAGWLVHIWFYSGLLLPIALNFIPTRDYRADALPSYLSVIAASLYLTLWYLPLLLNALVAGRLAMSGRGRAFVGFVAFWLTLAAVSFDGTLVPWFNRVAVESPAQPLTLPIVRISSSKYGGPLVRVGEDEVRWFVSRQTQKTVKPGRDCVRADFVMGRLDARFAKTFDIVPCGPSGDR